MNKNGNVKRVKSTNSSGHVNSFLHRIHVNINGVGDDDDDDDDVRNYKGSKRTGQGTNSASKLLSMCLACMDSMLSTTKSKFMSSAISPITTAGRLPSPALSINLNSSKPPA